MKLFRIELKAKTEPKPPLNPALGVANVSPEPVHYLSGPRGNVWIIAESAEDAIYTFSKTYSMEIVNRFDSMWLVADTDNPLTEEYFFFNNN